MEITPEQRSLAVIFTAFPIAHVIITLLIKKIGADISLSTTSIAAAILYIIGHEYEKVEILSDVGIGIAAADIANLLDMFLQATREEEE